MPNCLKSGVDGALHPILQIFVIYFFFNISSLCSLYWYAHLHNIVSTIRMIRMNKTVALSKYRYINIFWPCQLHMIHWIHFWQYDWCGHPTHLYKYLGILHLLISQCDGCYVIVCVLWRKHNKSCFRNIQW